MEIIKHPTSSFSWKRGETHNPNLTDIRSELHRRVDPSVVTPAQIPQPGIETFRKAYAAPLSKDNDLKYEAPEV